MNEWTGRPFLAVLRAKEEDRFTAYLAELLRHPEVLSRFLSAVCQLSTQAIAGLRIATQFPCANGRPDFVITDDKLRLVFEAKVQAQPYEDQLIRYGRDLQQWVADGTGRMARLFLLTPQDSSLSMPIDGQRALMEAGISDVPFEVVTWQRIAALMNSLVTELSDQRLLAHLRDFADLVAWRMEGADRPMTRGEVELLQDRRSGVALRLAQRLAWRTTKLLEKSPAPVITSSDYSKSGSEFSNGWNLRIDGREFWFGVWVDVWSKHGGSPIFLEIPRADVIGIPDGYPKPIECRVPQNDNLVVPLPLRADVDPSEGARENAEIITWYLMQFAG